MISRIRRVNPAQFHSHQSFPSLSCSKLIIHQCRVRLTFLVHTIEKNLLSHIIRIWNVFGAIIKTFLTTSTCFNYSKLLHSHYCSHNADNSSSILIECATSLLMTTFILSYYFDFLVVKHKIIRSKYIVSV